MKKIFFATAILAWCLLVGFSGKTQSTKAPATVARSFEENFGNTVPLTWKKIRDFYVAVAIVENSRIEAYFDKDGAFRGVGRYLEIAAIPGRVAEQINMKFSGYKVKQAYEYKCNEEGLSYYFDLKDDRNSLTLRLSPQGQQLYSLKKKIRNPETNLAKNSKK